MFKKNYKGLIRQCGLVIALGVMGVSSTAIAAVAASSHEFGDEKALNDICVKLCNFVAENFDIMEMRTGNVNLTSLKPDTLLTLLNEETYNKERILSKIDALINNTSENMLEIAALLPDNINGMDKWWVLTEANTFLEAIKSSIRSQSNRFLTKQEPSGLAEAARLAAEQEEARRIASGLAERRLNNAAITVQKIVRGKNARKQAKALRVKKAREKALKEHAATKIQSIVRTKKAQKKYKKLQKAVTKLQAKLRDNQEKKRVAEALRAKLASEKEAIKGVEEAMAAMQAEIRARDEEFRREAAKEERAATSASSTATISSDDDDSAPAATFTGPSVPTVDVPGRFTGSARGGFVTARGDAEAEIVRTGAHDEAVRLTDEARAARLAQAPGTTRVMQMIIDEVRASGKGKIAKKAMVIGLCATHKVSPAQQAIIFQELGLVSN